MIKEHQDMFKSPPSVRAQWRAVSATTHTAYFYFKIIPSEVFEERTMKN